MTFVAEVLRWFADAAHWTGSDGLAQRTVEHVELCALAVLVALVIALPAGSVLGHVKRGGLVAVAVVNIGRAIPSFGVIAIALPISLRVGLGLGFWPTFAALVVLAVPPLFTTAFTAVRSVDPGAVAAARGLGMRARQVLTDVELPLAAPVIAAAVRVTAVQVVATAPLGALVAFGGLGRFIIDGFAQRDLVEAGAGAVSVALLSIATDAMLAASERFLLPRGVRRLRRSEGASLVGRAA